MNNAEKFKQIFDLSATELWAMSEKDFLAWLNAERDVKHGKWVSNEFLYTTGQTICSNCKTEFYVDDLLNVGEGAQEYLPNYCPNCGAQMEIE